MWSLEVIIALNEKAHQDHLKKTRREEEDKDGGKPTLVKVKDSAVA